MSANLYKEISFKAMGSPCEIKIYLNEDAQPSFFFNKLRVELERLEQKYSKFRADSLLSHINANAAKGVPTELDAETLSIIDHASSCFHHSDGLFDITAGALNKLWDFRKNEVPSAQKISDALLVTGFNKLSIDNTLLKMPVGMELDLGGVVKEYAADALAVKANQLGVKNGIINLGGDIAVIGCQPGGKSWPVGISNPEKFSSAIAKIHISSGGLASSGDYQRFFFFRGKRYSHIINPKTGHPSSGLRTVSVAANLCTVAGSIATIAMLKREESALEWLNELDLPYVVMDSTGKLNRSKNSDVIKM
ncbi:MAG: FAD:protein FMN transferase [Gammaproteobacteria bacterium]|nr:FAD:protein FMN transferase [Gammaproteobacteria bacterium]